MAVIVLHADSHLVAGYKQFVCMGTATVDCCIIRQIAK